MKMMLFFTTGPSVASHEWVCPMCHETVAAMVVHDCGIVPPPREIDSESLEPIRIWPQDVV